MTAMPARKKCAPKCCICSATNSILNRAGVSPHWYSLAYLQKQGSFSEGVSPSGLLPPPRHRSGARAMQHARRGPLLQHVHQRLEQAHCSRRQVSSAAAAAGRGFGSSRGRWPRPAPHGARRHGGPVLVAWRAGVHLPLLSCECFASAPCCIVCCVRCAGALSPPSPTLTDSCRVAVPASDAPATLAAPSCALQLLLKCCPAPVCRSATSPATRW